MPKEALVHAANDDDFTLPGDATALELAEDARSGM